MKERLQLHVSHDSTWESSCKIIYMPTTHADIYVQQVTKKMFFTANEPWLQEIIVLITIFLIASREMWFSLLTMMQL